MRVALIAPFGLRPKGTTTARVLPIGRVLAAQGATVRVIIPPWDDPERAGERWTEDGVEVVHTKLGPRPLRPATILWDIGRELRAFRPDVVHAFKPIGYSGAVARRLAGGVARGGPLVVVDADDLEGSEGWAGRRRLGIGGRLRGAQERRTLRTAPLVTVASSWLADFVGDLGVSPERVLRLPNGHGVVRKPGTGPELGTRNPEPGPELAGRDSELLWYTRFTEASPGRAARMLAPLLRAHPELRITVLGDELEAGARAVVQGALSAEGVASQTRWASYEQPPSPNPHAIAVYLMDDDLVNRARCPSKVPQLMALGIPIVAEAVGEIPTYLGGFESECLAPPGDDVAFRERVAALLASKQRRGRLSKRLQRAAEPWRWDRVSAGLMEWYQSHLLPP
jgi:glycosyltransferase involved in cell wall biosynthesis